MKNKPVKKLFFQEFIPKEISHVLNISEVVSFPKDSIIFKRGDESNCFYIISTGHIEIFSFERGEQVVLAIIKTGSIIGEIGFLDGNDRSASARALTDVVALKISREVFANLEETNIKLAIKLMQEIEGILADRLRNSNKLLVDYQTVKIDESFLQKVEIKTRQTI